jgi:hypothetical protein
VMPAGAWQASTTALPNSASSPAVFSAPAAVSAGVCVCSPPNPIPSLPTPNVQGAFAELWESLGISAGDTLQFKRDPLTGSIDMARHLIGNTKAEEVHGWPCCCCCAARAARWVAG